MSRDFEQQIAAMSAEQKDEVLQIIAEAWDVNDFETIGVILEDNGLTRLNTDDDEEDLPSNATSST